MMGGRSIPEKCQHGVYVSGGDFLSDESCLQCEALDVQADAAYELGAAWQEAEAAGIPEDWSIRGIVRTRSGWSVEATRLTGANLDPKEYRVIYGDLPLEVTRVWVRMDGPTPTAALRALTAKLRGEG
jgi:hypothetical protein